MKVLVIHGPNLGLLGHRDPTVYGSCSLRTIDDLLEKAAGEAKVTLECRQSEHEGALVEWLHEAISTPSGGAGLFAAVLINPAAYSHTSLAIGDAVAAVVDSGVPVVEVHLSNVHGREEIRRSLLTGARASGVIAGFGETSYTLGLEAAIKLAGKND